MHNLPNNIVHKVPLRTVKIHKHEMQSRTTASNKDISYFPTWIADLSISENRKMFKSFINLVEQQYRNNHYIVTGRQSFQSSKGLIPVMNPMIMIFVGDADARNIANKFNFDKYARSGTDTGGKLYIYEDGKKGKMILYHPLMFLLEELNKS